MESKSNEPGRLLRMLPSRLKKYLFEYLDTKVIFFIDLTLSFLSSVLILFFVSLLSSSEAFYLGRFALWWMGASVLASIISLLIFKNHKVVIRYSQLRDLLGIFRVSAVKVVLMLPVIVSGSMVNRTVLLAFLTDFLLTSVLLIGVRIAMIFVYDIYKNQIKARQNCQRVLVYGTTEKSVSMVSRLKDSPHYQIIGFLVPHSLPAQYKVADTPVYGYNDVKQLASLFDRFTLDCILFATESEAQLEKDTLIQFCTEHGVKVLLAPTIDEVVGGRIMKNKVRQIKIEDLLGREEIKLSLDEIRREFMGKTILVTGAAGSIGSELCRQLTVFGIKKLILYDNAETPMHNIRLELEGRFPDLDFVPVIGDVRQPARLDYVFRKFHPEIVFHAAAYKHVPLMEEYPNEAVMANILGTKNVADLSVKYDVKRFIMISTDKAVNPTNVMGASKRIAEIYVQSLFRKLQQQNENCTKFITTRFGNVLGSNGSVIPYFKKQIASGGPVTVTHPDITRFFMTIPEACTLVLEAATLGNGGEIFVFDMGTPVRIYDLAKNMIRLAGYKPGEDIMITFTGLRPGEKLYEEVLNQKETTMPTSNKKIMIAKVRESEYDVVSPLIDSLIETAALDKPMKTVKEMKQIVPEYKSKNSIYEQLD